MANEDIMAATVSTLTLPSSQRNAADLAPGTVIGGDLRIVSKIGEGGMGAVYLAVDMGPLGRNCAVKILDSGGADPSRRGRFLDEARIMASLRHPNIVPVSRFGTDDPTGFAYYVMDEFLPTDEEVSSICREVLHCQPPARKGGAKASLTLSDLIEGGKSLPEAAVVTVALQILSAIEAAHALSPPVIHRDIKPSNILFAPDGRALLADFGIAKRLRSGDGAGGPATEGWTLPNATPGTFAYAAPEQMAGDAVSPATDYYSFGLVLFRALTGGMPSRTASLPTDIAPYVSRVWRELFDSLLEPNPAKRLSDPAAIHALLDRIATHPARSTSRGRPWLDGALLVLVAAALCLAVIRWRQANRSATAPGDGQGMDSAPQGVQSAPAAVKLAPLCSASPAPPRLFGTWQGDWRGPMQLLNTFRQTRVDDAIDEAIAALDPEIRDIFQKGDAAWTAQQRDFGTASTAYLEASIRLRDALNAAEADAGNAAHAEAGVGASTAFVTTPEPALRIGLAAAMSRLAWRYLFMDSNDEDFGQVYEVYKAALDALTPLVEEDASRYAPLRAWLLAERGFMEGMNNQPAKAVDDFRESLAILQHHPSAGNEGDIAQVVALLASISGIKRDNATLSSSADAIETTDIAINALASILDGNFDGISTRDASPRFRSLIEDLLAGSHYRLGQLLVESGGRLESLQNFRKARDLWRGLYQARGESYRRTYAQTLERICSTCCRLEEFDEALSIAEELLETLRPLYDANPGENAMLIVYTLENIAKISRAMGDEERARASEQEAARIRQAAGPTTQTSR